MPVNLAANRFGTANNNSTVGSIGVVQDVEPPSPLCNSTLLDMVELVETSIGVHTQSNGSPSKDSVAPQPCESLTSRLAISSNNTATVGGGTSSSWPFRSSDEDSTAIMSEISLTSDELPEDEGEVQPRDRSSSATAGNEEYLSKEKLGEERRFHRRSQSLPHTSLDQRMLDILGSEKCWWPSRLQSLSRARSEFVDQNHELANGEGAPLERSALQLCRHRE